MSELERIELEAKRAAAGESGDAAAELCAALIRADASRRSGGAS